MDLTQWAETFTMLHTKTWLEAVAWRNEPAAPSQVRALNMLLRQGMLDKNNRECKLAIVSKMVNSQVDSTKELSKIEAHVLIEILKDEKLSTEKEWALSADGANWIYQAELDWLQLKYSRGTP